LCSSPSELCDSLFITHSTLVRARVVTTVVSVHRIEWVVSGYNSSMYLDRWESIIVGSVRASSTVAIMYVSDMRKSETIKARRVGYIRRKSCHKYVKDPTFPQLQMKGTRSSCRVGWCV
jgi:hypothetical protein